MDVVSSYPRALHSFQGGASVGEERRFVRNAALAELGPTSAGVDGSLRSFKIRLRWTPDFDGAVLLA